MTWIELFIGYVISWAKWLLLWLLGGAPPTDDKEAFRAWCLKNHKYLAMLVSKTKNTIDDAISEIIRTVCSDTALFGVFWDKLHSDDTNDIDADVKRGFFERIRLWIAEKRLGTVATAAGSTEAEAEDVAAAASMMNALTAVVSAVKQVQGVSAKRKAVTA